MMDLKLLCLVLVTANAFEAVDNAFTFRQLHGPAGDKTTTAVSKDKHGNENEGYKANPEYLFTYDTGDRGTKDRYALNNHQHDGSIISKYDKLVSHVTGEKRNSKYRGLLDHRGEGKHAEGDSGGDHGNGYNHHYKYGYHHGDNGDSHNGGDHGNGYNHRYKHGYHRGHGYYHHHHRNGKGDRAEDNHDHHAYHDIHHDHGHRDGKYDQGPCDYGYSQACGSTNGHYDDGFHYDYGRDGNGHNDVLARDRNDGHDEDAYDYGHGDGYGGGNHFNKEDDGYGHHGELVENGAPWGYGGDSKDHRYADDYDYYHHQHDHDGSAYHD